MDLTRSALLTGLIGGIGTGACAPNDPPPSKETIVTSKPEVPAEPVKAPAPVEAPGSEPATTPAITPTEAPPPETTPPAHASLVKPEPGVTPWVERPELSEIRGFHPFVFGVLAECGPDGDRWCELAQDGRLLASKIADPEDEVILGAWPSDAWRVHAEEDEKEQDYEQPEYEAWVTVDLSRWNGRRFTREGRFKVDLDPMVEMAGNPSYLVRKAWAGGMLFYDMGTRLQRVPAKGPGKKLSGDVGAVFEAESGGVLYMTSEGNFQSAMHPPCSAGSCPGAAFMLPGGDTTDPSARWMLKLDVPRGGDAITIVAEKEDELYLLHYDAPTPGAALGDGTTPAGRWTLEGLPYIEANVDVIWPDAQGGLWLDADPKLWYREASGRWFEVARPEGTLLGYANRHEPRELLTLVRDADGTYRVFSTRGPVTPRATDPSEARGGGTRPVPPSGAPPSNP